VVRGDRAVNVVADDTPSFIGRTLGHYVIVDKLGEGGMGVVYRARDPRLDRFVALKILPARSTNNPDHRRRFTQEAKAASALNHPNIVTVHDVGAVDGVSFIAMEYVKGATLRQTIGASGMPLERVLNIAAQIADALIAAHAAGVLHRDLKPGNIMISDGRIVKVLDFGLAKLMDPARPADEFDATRIYDHGRTQEGMVVGTIAYMSPEQLEGKPLGPSTDTFSFGCVMYEMLSGQAPFGTSATVSTIAAVLSRTPASIRASRTDVPAELGLLIAACLAKDPAARPAIAEVKRVLDDLRYSRDATAALRSIVRQPPAWRRAAIAGAVVVASTLLFAGGWYLWASRTRELPPLKVLKRISADAGLTAYPALSPDGKLLAYASDRGVEGVMNIWMRQVAGGDPIRLTNGESDDLEPSFSPNGSQIVFRSERNGGGIYVVSALGGAPRQIAGNGRRPRFSPDGRWIAFRSGTSSNSGEFERIYLVPAGGGEPRAWHPEFSSAREPVWSPDGRFILFLGKRDANTVWPQGADWWVAPVEGGAPQATGAFAALGVQAFGDFTAPEAWIAPNDIVFSWRVGDSTNVWRVPLSRSRTIAGPPQQLTFGAGLERQPSVSPAGSVVFASETERLNVWGLAIEPARGAVDPEVKRYTQGEAIDGSPTISTAGDRFAFVSNKAGSDEVWVHDVTTGQETMLSGVPGRKGLAVVSHDGSQVAFAVDENGKTAIYVSSSRGGLVKRVCESCGPPRSWTLDKQHLVYQARTSDRSEFFLLDVASKQSVAIVTNPDRDVFSGTISSDGRWITFQAKRKGADGQQIVVAPFRTTGVRPDEWIPITTGEFEDDKPRWSADGGTVYFTSTRDGFRCLWSAQLAAATKRPIGEPAIVHHFHRARLGMMYPTLNRFDVAVARDKIVFTLVERTANLWMATPETAASR
jgi:serine/threonine protein kinase/Tol biopolymer transport system component